MSAAGAVLGTGGLVGLAGPAQAASAIPSGCTHSSGGAEVTCTFAYTGDVQTFTVPDGVTSVDLDAWGGDGATPFSTSPGAGGRGAHVSGTFEVTAGATLAVTVAQDGQAVIGGTAPGGYGYGTGGASLTPSGASGGGGSAVADGDTVLIVAGGGGAGGKQAGSCTGGNGGDAGQNGAGDSCHGAAGGVAGGSSTSDGTAYTAGNLADPDGGAGGGGGGYRGGLGGQNFAFQGGTYSGAGGGGGGTSYADPSGTGVDLSQLSDRSHGSNGRVTISFAAPDTAAPVADPQVGPGQPNAAGWYDAPVDVSWQWSDQDSAVDPDACTQSSSSSGEGTQSLSATCADVWGNVATASQTVKVDSTKPGDAPVVTKTATGVSVDWNWTDATSGVDPASCQQTTSQTGTGQVTVGSSCTDIAGNTATDSVTVDNDRTGPTDAPVLTPAANANGWNDTDVSVAWNWTDDESGVDGADCTQQSTSSGEGADVAVSAPCSDVDGNASTDTVHLKVDQTTPVDDPVVTTSATGASVAWNWSDALSGVDSSSCTQSSSQTGTGQLTLTSSCTDLAGNTATDSKTVTVSQPATKADLKTTITGPATGRTNTRYTFRVTVANAGPASASSVGTTVLLPGHATLVSASGRYSRLGPLVVWKNVPSLAANASTSYTVTVKYTRKGVTGLAAVASSLRTPDPDLLNNAALARTRIE